MMINAIQFSQFGPPSVLVERRLDSVGPSVGEVLIRVVACGVNHLDSLLRQGFLGTIHLPHTLGSEVVGEVLQVGDGVVGIGRGQRVAIAPWIGCGHCAECLKGEESVCREVAIVGWHSDGGYASEVRVAARGLVPIPTNVPWLEAVGVLLAGSTAYHMVMRRGNVKPGETVLVIAAASGVSSIAIKLAKLCGAVVIASVGSSKKAEFARQLGADFVVRHDTTDFVPKVMSITSGAGVDVIIEHVGQSIWSDILQCTAPNCRLLTCGATTGAQVGIDIAHIFSSQLRIIGVRGSSRSDIHAVLALISQGKLAACIDRVMPLSNAAQAHEQLEGRSVSGKLILVPAPDSEELKR